MKTRATVDIDFSHLCRMTGTAVFLLLCFVTPFFGGAFFSNTVLLMLYSSAAILQQSGQY
ncbi:MAG: hypothetical protein CSB48_01360 [Proteobacteria bacterium]|nr:MAG: hypothetical protein CSB48_01360 [Pseudomonadota bacterium]